MNTNIRSRLFAILLLFCATSVALFLIFIVTISSRYSAGAIKEDLGGQVVALNGVVKLSAQLKDDPGNAHLGESLGAALAEIDLTKAANAVNGQGILNDVKGFAMLLLITSLVFMVAALLYLYVQIIKPFYKLEQFAQRVAAGDFDFSLSMDRSNMFGAFSWAFDLLRTELKTAKQNELEALQAKKALIATISHDIKTPVASIRAYAEGLGNGMAATEERRQRYLSVIIKKADEVANLTNDLFLHAISDMDKLSIAIGEYPAPAMLQEILDPFVAEYGDRLELLNDVPDVRIFTDERRLAQAFENILTNAAKYTQGGQMQLSFSQHDGFLECSLRDFGSGIPPEDMPFILNRFYRGRNAGDIRGSGLGLYIVNYIMDKTGGYVKLENTENGLLATLGIKSFAI